jgi:superfamily II DNA or RNA helicase
MNVLRFDRGTLCLGEGRGLPGAVWDERVGVWRVAAYRYASIAAAARGGSVTGGPALRDDVGRARSAVVGRWIPPLLRAYQESALAAWTARGRRGLVVLPTGAGKTRLALAAMARTGAATVILVPTRALLEQWERQIVAFYGGPVGVVGDGVLRLEAITVMTFESAYRRLDDFGDRFDLLVVDEAHHFASGQRAEALEMCTAPLRLGLTATPPPEGSAGAERLAELVGPLACEVRLGELMGTHLANFDVVTLHVGLTDLEANAYERASRPFLQMRRAYLRASPDATWAETMRAIARGSGGPQAIRDFSRACAIAAFPEAKRHLVRELLQTHARDRTLVFTARTEDAYAIALDRLIPVITSETKREERREILERFGDGRYRAIVSARVLNEGIDVPDARVAVVVSGALGAREHVQRVGRVLRPFEGKRAVVYELITRGTIDDARARQRSRNLASHIAARV